MPKAETKTFASLRDKILSQNGKDYWLVSKNTRTRRSFAIWSRRSIRTRSKRGQQPEPPQFVKVMGASLALAGLSGCVIQRRKRSFLCPPRRGHAAGQSELLRDGNVA